MTGDRLTRRAARQSRQSRVDDPYEPGAKIVTLRNLRDDPLGRLHDRNQIDEAQFQAGRRFQADWERAEKGLVRSTRARRPWTAG